MQFRARIVLLIILIAGIAVPGAWAGDPGSATYSFVHLSDTQNLATYFPSTYNLTFSTLESWKDRYNISAIIITGDLVNTWNRQKEWDAYSRARNLTTIPVFVIAGNHDTSSGKKYDYYARYSGRPNGSYVTSLEDFDFVGIDYTGKTLPARDLSRIRARLLNSTRPYAIIATHYYMDRDGTPSALGRDIGKNLVVKPTIILTGHLHADFLLDRTINGFPVVEEMTNYQNGLPGGNGDKNYSAGMLYTVTTSQGSIEKIAARNIRIWPVAGPGEDRIVYQRTPSVVVPVVTPNVTEKPVTISSRPAACVLTGPGCLLKIPLLN